MNNANCPECGQRRDPRYNLCQICYYANLPHEGIVVGAVLRYFKPSRFRNFSIQREYEIQMGSDRRRADVVLLNGEDIIAIAECKNLEYVGTDGIEQLESYLSASDTKFGLFADNTDPSEWRFLKNLGRNNFVRINLSEFEAEIGIDPLPQRTQIFLILEGDITQARVDAIVNTTDNWLSGESGLDGRIRRAGGDAIDEECTRIRTERGVLPPGQAVITAGGNLRVEHLIHTVGPVWQGGNSSEPEQLANCYKSSLQLAVDNRIQSIAFPAISTGHYGYPPNEAASVALTAIGDFVEQAQQRGDKVPTHIHFFLHNEETYICYVKALSQLKLSLSCVIGLPRSDTISGDPSTPTGDAEHTETSHASEERDFIGRGKKAVGGFVDKSKKAIEGFINKGKNRFSKEK